VDLPDVRCQSLEHPHRGAHTRTLVLNDGTQVSVFWWTPDLPAADQRLDEENAARPPRLSALDGDDGRPLPQRTPERLRRRTDSERGVLVP
jgi:hypothetical protein